VPERNRLSDRDIVERCRYHNNFLCIYIFLAVVYSVPEYGIVPKT
jgi:hypothetical protein